MTMVVIDDSNLTNIANAIREKTGGSERYQPNQMAAAISAISGSEDLSEELTEQETLLDDQTDKINEAIVLLANKVSSSRPTYTSLNYIQFTGEQTIDTGITCTHNTKLKIAFTREKDSANYLYGVASAGNTATVTAYLSSGGAWRFGNKSASVTLTTSEDMVHSAIVDKTGIARAGTTQSFSDTNDFEAIGTLTLGSCRNSSGSLGSAQFVGKIFAFAIWENEELVLNFIPAIDINGVCGFWDTVSQTFFTSLTATPLEGGYIWGE